MDSSKSVVIYASVGDSLDFGDTVSLFAVLHGYENTEYDIQWQMNSGDGWEDIPASNVMRYELENGSWFAIRPSGTEPKIKFYFYAKADNKEEAQAAVVDMKTAVGELVDTIE